MTHPVKFRVSAATKTLIRGLHPELKVKVRAGFDAIRLDPLSGKPLQKELEGLRSLRVGRLRIVYRLCTKRILEIVAIGPRRTIYEQTMRKIGASEDER